ncbi:hypothetical protein K3495_g14225 [Podosphaera aphanis]|nr:hypothetical protein K3495_g14225 [Podosphaera aphanis]
MSLYLSLQSGNFQEIGRLVFVSKYYALYSTSKDLKKNGSQRGLATSYDVDQELKSVFGLLSSSTTKEANLSSLRRYRKAPESIY